MRGMTDLTRYVLEKRPYARDDDNLLYLEVLREIAEYKGMNVATMNVPEFFVNAHRWGFPSYVTISRARRRVQEEDPDLMSSKNIVEIRKTREEVFREWARRKDITG